MTEVLVDRSARCKLINFLRRLQGDEGVIMRTVGGFQFEAGRLVRIEDCFAVGTDVDVRLPGGGTIELGNVTVNLCALTSIGVDN